MFINRLERKSEIIDKRLVETLIQINENEIDHPESLLKKYPRLQKLVKWIVKIWQWTFGIFGTIAKWVMKKIGENKRIFSLQIFVELVKGNAIHFSQIPCILFHSNQNEHSNNLLFWSKPLQLYLPNYLSKHLNR